MIVPSDHQEIVEELSRLEGEVQALVAPLADEGLNRQPEDGRGGRGWSVAQCVDHLSRSNAIYLPALAAAVDKGRKAGRSRRDRLAPGRLGRWFVAEMEPPPRHRWKAPKREMFPPSRHEKEALLAGFSRQQSAVIELVRGSSDIDLSRVRFRNPMAGNLPLFNLATGFLVIAAHERRHLWQARNVLATGAARG